MAPTSTFRFATDTATVAIFDPARLEHRRSDSADWWSLPADEVREINLGNMFTVSTGTDGVFELEVRFGAHTGSASHVEALIACDSGRLFIGPGEVIPSDGLPTTDQFGGRFFDIEAGVYHVFVSSPRSGLIQVHLLPTDSPAENHYEDSPRVY